MRDTAEGGGGRQRHGRRGNAGLIIHTYCSGGREGEGESDRKRKKEGEDDGGKMGGWKEGGRVGHSLGSSAFWEQVQCKPWAVEGEGGRYS